MPVRFIVDPTLPANIDRLTLVVHVVRRRQRAAADRFGRQLTNLTTLMAHAHDHAPHAEQVLRPARQPLADRRLGRAVHDDGRRRAAGSTTSTPAPWVLVARPRCCCSFMFVGWFGDVIRESEARPLQRGGRPLVPHGDDVVHLLRGDVLRRVLRRAVLRAPVLGAVARRRRRRSSLTKVLLWRELRGGVADQRPGQRRRRLRDDPGVRPAAAQHRDPADLGRHDHHRAPRAARPAIARAAEHLPGG